MPPTLCVGDPYRTSPGWASASCVQYSGTSNFVKVHGPNSNVHSLGDSTLGLFIAYSEQYVDEAL